MKKFKVLTLAVMSLVSMTSLSALAADKDSKFDPSTLIPGAEAAVSIPVAKFTVNSAKGLAAAEREIKDLEKNGGKGNRYADPNLYGPYSEAGTHWTNRALGTAALGALGTDMVLRGNQIAHDVKIDNMDKSVAHYSTVAAGGLTAVSVGEYAAAHAPGAAYGNRAVGAAALGGAAYLASKGDRESTETAVGHAATLITGEQVFNVLKKGVAGHGEFITPRMGIAMTSLTAATLYGDVYLAEKRKNGEKAGAPSAAAVVTRSGLKPMGASIGELIEESAPSTASTAGSAR